MGGWNRLDRDLAAILAFVFALALLNQAPWLLVVFGGLAFVGWLLVQLGVFEDESEDEADRESESADPLAALQTRYANGEIDDVEFERRLERILESDDLVRDGARKRERGPERDGNRDGGGDLDRGSGRDVDDRDFDVETT